MKLMQRKQFLKLLSWMGIGALCSMPSGASAESSEEEPAKVLPPPKKVTDLYKSIAPDQIPENTFKLIGQEWMIISAGDQKKFNGMTASWGGFGVWRFPVAFILVHNTRYTYEFLEKEDYFTLSFFDQKYRPQLDLYGNKSGRDIDKVKAAGFTPLWFNPGMAYAEARMIIQCKKLYADRTRAECWLPPKAATSSPEDKVHKLYFGEVVGVWVRK